MRFRAAVHSAMTLASTALLAAGVMAIPTPAPAPFEIGVMLSAGRDICVGTRVGTHVLRDRPGIDSARGWLQSGQAQVEYYVGFGLGKDWRHGRRTEMPDASHGFAEVHGWEDRNTAAVIVEGLTGPHGASANVWLQYAHGDTQSRQWAKDLARTTHYCREGRSPQGTQWRTARRQLARERAAIDCAIRRGIGTACNWNLWHLP